MGTIEIPLLRESAAFSARLIDAAKRFGEPQYHLHRRVNWSHRYGVHFYAREAECFQASPEAYLSGRSPQAPELEDVYGQHLRLGQVAVVLLKVLAHWLFLLLGRRADRRLKARQVQIYRKAYVDDIELVFDPAEAGVVRAVYPFPINLRRQLRYLAFLRRERLDFKLAGNPYRVRDLIRFVVRRDVRSLKRMESRSQILHARQVIALGMRRVQLSDEFDIGSLDFTRRLRRSGLQVINSAHGVGKYLPVHAYEEFHVLTRKQQQYYHAVRDCRYALRRLNDRPAAAPSPPGTAPLRHAIGLVFLSQTFAGLAEVIASNEAAVVARLRDEFGGMQGITLFYKPHPNRKDPQVPAGFTRLANLEEVNGHAGTVFVSFFSTCQIDPAFKGHKLLLRGDLIYPEIAFDDSETILDLAALVEWIRHRLPGRRPACAARAPKLRSSDTSLPHGSPT
jgi:hypothetical protein